MSEQNRTLLAIALMGLILMVFFSDWYQEKMAPGSTQPRPKPHIESTLSSTDTSSAVLREDSSDRTEQPSASLAAADTVFDLVDIVITTPLVELHLSNKGGGTLQKVYLNNYLKKDSSRVQLISEEASGVLSNEFIGYEIESLNTQDLVASVSLGDKSRYDIYVEDRPVSFSFEIPFGGDSRLVRTFTFYPDSFHFDLHQELVNLGEINAGRYFATVWSGGVAPTEQNRKDDLYYSELYALLGDDKSPTDYSADKSREVEVQTATTSWVAARSKYFTAILIPETPISEFKSERYQTTGADEHSEKIFNFELRDSFDRRVDVGSSNFRVYVGPLDFEVLQTYGLYFEEMMNWGWFGIIGKGALWVFKAIYGVIPNYGIVLIIFSILVKLLLHPLTKKQFASTQNMQQAQPQVAALKEKYKDDPKRLNEETMKLYKELGINPLGGCLPLLIQMPILIAMFNLFRTTIELRGAAFKGLEFWIADLSLPDTVGTIAGININLLPVIMSGTMILQQKLMAPANNANPQMKNMPYIMTAVFFFMFYTFPSGLNLYYTLFNLMSIAQQALTKKTPLPVVASSPVKPASKKQKK